MADFRFNPIPIANPGAAYAQGQQDRNQNKLLQLQQQYSQQQAQSLAARDQRDGRSAGMDEQSALREDVGRAADWALSGASPEEQQGRWNQVVDSFKSQYGDAVEQYRPIEQLPAVAAWAKNGGLPKGQQTPSAVSEYQFFQTLSPEKQAEYLRVKRAEQIKEIGGVQSLVAPGGAVKPLGTLGGEVEAARAIAEGTALGKTAGESTGTARANLPKAEGQADEMLAVIDGILKDPAFAGGVGLKGPGFLFGAKEKPIAGTPEAGFQSRVDQLQGQAFLQAFESLKGGGQITEVEGRKATEAIGRLSTAQSESAFRGAMNELKGIIVRAKSRARAKAASPDAGGWSIEEIR